MCNSNGLDGTKIRTCLQSEFHEWVSHVDDTELWKIILRDIRSLEYAHVWYRQKKRQIAEDTVKAAEELAEKATEYSTLQAVNESVNNKNAELKQAIAARVAELQQLSLQKDLVPDKVCHFASVTFFGLWSNLNYCTQGQEV